MSTVRICHTQDFPMVIEVMPTGQLQGLFSQYAIEGYEFLLKGTNASFVFSKNHGFGSRQNDSLNWDGCIGRLQRNESDVLWIISRYPLVAENVTEGVIVAETGLNFLSVYYDKEQVTQMLTQSFSSFHVSVWMSIVFALITSCLLLRLSVYMNWRLRSLFCSRAGRVDRARDARQRRARLKKRLMARHKGIPFKVVRHFSRIDQIDVFSPTSRLIFILLSIMSLVVVHYFSSSIKTEMVVIPYPDIIESYQDFQNENALPLFTAGSNAEYRFINAKAGSPEHSLWQYILRRKVPLDSMIAHSGSWSDFYKNTDLVLERKLVIMVDALLAPIFKRSACLCLAKKQETMFSYMGDGKKMGMRVAQRVPQVLPNYKILVKSDPGSVRNLVGNIFSSHMDKKLFLRVKRTMTFVLEAGLMSVQFDRALKQDWLEDVAGANERDRLQYLDDCMRDTVFMKEPSFSPLSFKQLSNFVLYCLALMLVATVVAIAEHFC